MAQSGSRVKIWHSRSRGFSLVGVLISVGVVSILALTLMTVIQNSVSGQALVRAKASAGYLQHEMTGLLSSRATCELNFRNLITSVGAPDTVTQILSAPGVGAVQEGNFYDNRAIRIENIRVTNFIAYGNTAPDNARGTMDVSFDTTPVGAGTVFITRIVRLSVELNSFSGNPGPANGIFSCIAIGNDQNNIWKVKNNGDIYYMGFNVGIGTDQPVQMLTVAGNIYAQTYLHLSDASKKRDIESSPGLALVEQLKGVRFRWLKSGRMAYGVIAQDVKNVMPEAVFTDPHSGEMSVDYDQILAPLIESVKELEARNKSLETRLNNLKSRVGRMGSRGQ